MANKAHLIRLNQGVEAWNAWRFIPPKRLPKGLRAKFSEAYRRAQLLESYLHMARSSGDYLRKANLYGAHLGSATLVMLAKKHAFVTI